MPDTKSKIAYDSRTAYKVGIKLNRNTDADLIAALDAAPNKQALIKEALRAYAIPSSWAGSWPAGPQCPCCGGEVDDEIIYMLDGRTLPSFCPYCGKNLSEREEKRTVKKYKVKTEYLDSWLAHGDSADEVIVDEDEINRLAREWGVTVDKLMEQVEEI